MQTHTDASVQANSDQFTLGSNARIREARLESIVRERKREEEEEEREREREREKVEEGQNSG
jgi:hypothetical protein